MTLIFSLFSLAFAQDLELPTLSPRATVTQQIGTLKVTVDYASPGKKDRTVWGELVPYDTMWRTGANGATTFETTGDLKVGGKDVPAGKYAVFTIPGKDSWTVILNKNPDQGGTGQYDEKLDQARFTVKPEAGGDRERLTFLFSDTDEDSARLDLEWAGVRVGLPIDVDSVARANADIDAYAKRAARRLADAGRFKAEHGDVPGGLLLIEQSMKLSETWYATWAKAELLAQKGDKKAAYAAAQQAHALGQAAGEGYFYKARVEKALAEWPKK
jgi:hypothetical protein